LSGTQVYQPTNGASSTDDSSITANRKKQLAMRQKAVDQARKGDTTNRGWKDRLRSKSNNDLLQSATATDSRPGTSHLDRPGTSMSQLTSTRDNRNEKRKSLKEQSSGSRRNTLKQAASTGTLIPDVRRMTGADLSGSMTPESLAFLERQEKILKRKTLEEASVLQQRRSQMSLVAPGPDSNFSRPGTPRLSPSPGQVSTPKGSLTPVRRGSETPSTVGALGTAGLQQPAPVAMLRKHEKRLSANMYAENVGAGNGFDFNGFHRPEAERERRVSERERRQADSERRRMQEEGLRLVDEENVTAFPEMREKGVTEKVREKEKKSRGCCGLW